MFLLPDIIIPSFGTFLIPTKRSGTNPACCPSPLQHAWFVCAGEEVKAEFFMEELNNGVKLCRLIGVLQDKVAQICPSALSQVSPVQKDTFLLVLVEFSTLFCVLDTSDVCFSLLAAFSHQESCV